MVTWRPCEVRGHCCWGCPGCRAPHSPHPLKRTAPDGKFYCFVFFSCLLSWWLFLVFWSFVCLLITCPFLLTPMMPLVGSCWAVTKIVSALILKRERHVSLFLQTSDNIPVHIDTGSGLDIIEVDITIFGDQVDHAVLLGHLEARSKNANRCVLLVHFKHLVTSHI